MVTIVFIGVSLILGLYFASVALKTTGLKYVDEHGFKDIDISCSIGIQDNEIEKILQIPGVNDAEGVLSFSGQISSKDKNAGAELISVTQRVSVPYVIDGSLLANPDECAVGEELLKN